MQQPVPPLAPSPIHRLVRLARLAVGWERMWPLILPPLALIGLFVGLALLDVLPLLPAWLHGLVLAALAGGVAFLSVRAALRLRWPKPHEALERLERDSGLPHQPLQSLSDHMAAGESDPLARILWQAHRNRLTAMAPQARLNWPDAGMAARDPLGWRAAVLLLLVIAITVGGHDSGNRLARAVAPAVKASALGDGTLEVWLTPPAYTGLSPMLLHPGQSGVVAVPMGSAVLALLTGGWGQARVVVDNSELEFQPVAEGGQRLQAPLPTGHTLSVRQGWRSLASWPLSVSADAVPSIAFAVPPEEGERGRLHLSLEASDDYGLVRAWVNVRRVGAGEDEPVAEVDLPLPSGHPKSADISTWKDLSSHAWAGLPVSLQPAARDGLGQVGTGEAMTITLPERSFSHPLAQALIAQRRALAADRKQAPATAELLGDVLDDTQALGDDFRLVLALAAAHAALTTDFKGFDLPDVLDLLWNAALRLEDGDLPAAERAVDEARRAVEQAVENNASAAEISALLDKFQAELERMLHILGQRAAQTGAPMPQQGQALTDDDLRDMMDRMRDLAQADARDALSQMLRQMQDLLSNLQTKPQSPTSTAATQALERLRQVTRQQQALLEDSRQRANQNAGQDPSGQAQRAQGQLRSALGPVGEALAKHLGDGAASTLAQADAAMGDAEASLSEGDWEGASLIQEQALAQLRQAARDAAEQLSASGQMGGGMIPRDPLGRAINGGAGAGDDGATRIPDHTETQRARQILDELRRRAGETSRPEGELDYLKRLLRQF